MEFEEYKQEEQSEEDYVDIYSRKAIFWFSVFNFIYGGVLLCINLWVAGYRKAVAEVLIFLLLVQFSYVMAIRYSGINISQEVIKKAASGVPLTVNEMIPLLQVAGITIAFHIAAAFILSRYFFRKYFPDDDYYPKPIFRPLIIYIILALCTRFMI
ncbi:hypothetical protein [Mucilaginibacter ginsenosidivorax]|uniref:Uncharacterized protein n=1 Tax=Mucilaginibacter ginsenosidivorax TaxID=862126 RepID=A0A5B8W9U1_9SPHI|nr:hypothetical protein [Mucilaginibacter ginsenosidivorax]QEC79725.1 hypothetical protein FSB76_28620 [Mucilaginibacter ginsenosidivorax]